MSPLVTTSGTYMIGDGLSIAETPSSATAMISRNDISGNDRFGIILTGSNAQLTGNTGTGNRFGFGTYGGDTMVAGTTPSRARKLLPWPRRFRLVVPSRCSIA